MSCALKVLLKRSTYNDNSTKLFLLSVTFSYLPRETTEGRLGEGDIVEGHF